MKDKKNKPFLHHFWTRESGMTSMLILICLLNFVILPLCHDHQLIMISINIFWMTFILAGVYTLTKTRKQRVLLSVIPILFILSRWMLMVNDHPFFLYLEFFLGLLTFLLLIAMVFTRVFEVGPITYHRIFGAIVVYMLIGNLFALVFAFLNQVHPGSFNIMASAKEVDSIYLVFIYFSYTTLTTTGFGDILPTSIWTRDLVIIEQVIGVLYPVVLIGKLVSSNSEKK